MSVNEKMTAIADAIRAKTGGTDTLTLDAMATEIESIESGGDSTDTLVEYLCGNYTDIVDEKTTALPTYIFAYSNMLTSYVGKCVVKMGAQCFRANSSVTKVDFHTDFKEDANTYNIPVATFYGCSALTTLILRGGSVIQLDGVNAFTNSPIANGTGYIYVPSALVEDYKAATNWTTYADQIRAIEDYPDVCGEVSA